MSVQPPEKIEIHPVTDRKGMKQFIRLPWHVYHDDPFWVPPLTLERRLHFSSLNPFFKHAEWQGWIAYRNNQPVGRICAQVDHSHREYFGKNTGHFGLLETEKNGDVVAALIDVVEDWLLQRDTEYVTGPFSFSINQECGVLVDGFDTPPVVMMPHSRPWYDQLLQEQDYNTAIDLLAYWVDLNFDVNRTMRTLFARYDKHVHIRTLERSKFSEELEILRDIFNDAWSRNWGFIPLTQAEFADLGNSLRLFLPDNFVQIAEIEGEPVAFIVMLPNLNEILKELDGKLLPFGWLRMARWQKQGSIRTGRVPLMGVRKKYQNTHLGIALAYMIINRLRNAARDMGLEEVELSWILENNKGMRSILDSIGSKKYKRYRIYEKTLKRS